MLVANNASGYNFGGYLAQALLDGGMSQEDVNKIKIWADYYRQCWDYLRSVGRLLHRSSPGQLQQSNPALTTVTSP